MDLSQQELPLTAYFTRGGREARPRTVSRKKDKPTEDLRSVARSSKRRKSDVQCSTTSPLGSSSGQSNSRTKTLQLPTPATSTRKRMRSGRLELPAKSKLTSTAGLPPAEQDVVLLDEEDFARLESGPTPSKSSREGADDAVLKMSSLATPSIDRRRITKYIRVESHSGPSHANHGETGIPTPRSSLREISESVQGIEDRSPLSRSYRLLPKPSQAPPGPPNLRQSHAVLSPQRSARSDACSSVDPNCWDPFHTHEKDNFSARRGTIFASPEQYSVQAKALDGQPADGHVIPMIPVPSSQSQYLLHPDATPKRKRCSQRIECVISSQTQEERELTLPTPHGLTSTGTLSVGVSPGK